MSPTERACPRLLPTLRELRDRTRLHHPNNSLAMARSEVATERLGRLKPILAASDVQVTGAMSASRKSLSFGEGRDWVEAVRKR